MHPAGVAPQPVAGGVVMMDVDAGLERLVGARLGAVAVAPASEDAAAAALMLQDKAAPAAGVAALFGIAPESDPAMGQEAAAVTPVVQNGLVAIEDKEAPGPLVALSAPKPTTMGDVAKLFREKHAADALEAARKRIAEKEKAAKDAIKAAKALTKEDAIKAAKAVLPIGKAKAAPASKNAKKVIETKVKKVPHPKVPDVSKGGSCPDDSLAYRGTSYAKVRYYKKSTIYHDVGGHQWRAKPFLGSRKTVKSSFRVNPKQAWAELVEIIREVNP